jgi:hypothetical protein
MNKIKTYKWDGAVTRLPDGHRIFTTYERDFDGGKTYGVAIADDSGRFPETTDDGVLWLDVTRCLMVMRDNSDPDRPREHIAIPLVDENGNQTRTPSDAATILFLSREFGWTIEDQTRGAYYGVH